MQVAKSGRTKKFWGFSFLSICLSFQSFFFLDIFAVLFPKYSIFYILSGSSPFLSQILSSISLFSIELSLFISLTFSPIFLSLFFTHIFSITLISLSLLSTPKSSNQNLNFFSFFSFLIGPKIIKKFATGKKEP